MKKIYLQFLLLKLSCLISVDFKAQCASPTQLGTSSNMFTKIRNGNSAVAVNKDMNMIVFIHRTDAALFGGNSGELRYDISTNAGTTWTLNEGVLNPQNSNYGRYPNIAIYNPSLNTSPANAYVSYLAPTITSATSVWNGIVSGVKPIGGGVPTESYNQNNIGTNQIPHSLVNGAPGVFWAIDPLVPSATTGYNIYKGVWNSSINDIVWGINYVASPPFSTAWSTFPTVGDYNIAFDPTGTTGYFSFLAHVTPGPTNYALYPVLYKTTDGGNTWTGPIQVDLTKLSCIASNTISGYVPSTNTEHDLVVDVNGNPHIITTVGNAQNYSFNYSSWHHMYDITLEQGLWTAYDLGNVNGAPYTAGISPNIAVQIQAPQAARSADGSKVFFTWTDNSTYSQGTQNSTPNLYGKAFDVITRNWTQTKDFTSCNTSAAGKIMFPHIAPEVLQPSTGVFKLAPVYGQPVVTNDLLQTAGFHFLDNVTFSTSEFTVAVPAATVSIAQAPVVLYCPNSTVNINVVNGGDVLWSNGYTLNPLPVTTGSISTYSVIAQAGCLIGTASISVVNLTVAAGPVSPTVCPATAAVFTVTGNALSYSWSPGMTGGSSATLTPSNNTVSVVAYGSNSCMVNNVVTINVLPSPTITITGNNTVCAGSPNLMLTGNGGVSYLWGDGSTGNTYTSIVNNPVTVIGTGANSCTNSASINLQINPSPVVTAAASQTAVCMGQSVTLQAFGASTYTWNGTSTGPNVAVTPLQNTTYTVVGANNFSCETSAMISLTVHPLPVLTVSLSRPSVCVKEKINLYAGGATSYTWLPNGVINYSVPLTPNTAGVQNFTVLMRSADNCTSSSTYSLQVAACTSIEEDSHETLFSIYPNPGTGVFSVISQKQLRLVVLNQLGQVILKLDVTEENPTEINLSKYPNGIYLVSDEEGSLRQPKKIILTR